MIEKCEHLIQNIRDMEESCHKTKGVDYKAIDLELAQEGHTMGNMITEWIYSKTPSDLLHISYHEPHPLKSTIVLRVGIDTKTDDEDVYIEHVKDFVIGHIKTLQEHLTELGKSWRDKK
jgi:DNA-directed RNA polymerase subunit L